VNIYPQRMEGWTLIEVAVTLSILAIALASSLPSWTEGINRRELISTAEQLSAFLSNVQGTSVKQNDALTVRLMHTSSTDWCIGISPQTVNCDCTVTDSTDAAFCAVGGMPQNRKYADFSKSNMTGHSTDTSYTFEPVRGFMINTDLATQHFFNLVSDNDKYALRVRVLPTGQVRACNFDPGKQVFGYENCTATFIDDGLGGS
jgi:Tfp pilus assembly protein FimT